MSVLSTVCTALALQAQPAPSTTMSTLVDLTPCRLEHPAGLRVHARCGSLDVAAGSTTMTVGFAVLKSTSAEPGLPLLLLSGGPGQAATRDFISIGPTLERLRQDRDVILVDARGTGRSTPLSCADDRPRAEQLAGVGDEVILARCLASLPVPLSALTTSHVVDDIERVRVRLGIERWHVLGVSYGTRVAAALAVAHPDRTASLVLDGVAPLDRALGDDIAADMEASLVALGASVRDDFVAVKAALAATPVSLTIPHPTTAAPFALTLTAASANAAVRMSLYSDESRALLPVMLKSARSGDYLQLASVVAMTVELLEGAIAPPVNLAVLCAEDVPFLRDVPHPSDAAFDDERPQMRRSCGAIAPLSSPFRPSRIVPPTLVLSGEVDPITPPHHARRAEPLFAQVRHLVAKRQGHFVLPRGCAVDIVTDTLAAVERGASLQSVDVDCLEQLDRFPVFIDSLGPAP
jgi:pimeloyl-ACP methyl ester carboxylesterase